MKIHPAPALFCAVIVLCSCATDKRQRQDQTAAVATVSAMAVALPLIPVASAFHALSGSSDKWKAQAEERRRVLDPIYQKRMELLVSRDPAADAQQCWQRGEAAFLPSLPAGALYPGLERTEFHLQERESNLATIARSELLHYLVRLMDRDPVHAEGDGVFYISPVWDAFLRTSWSYKTKFNLELYRLRKEAKPNKAPKPTLTSVTSPADAGAAPVAIATHL